MGRRGSSRRSKGLYVPRWTVNITVAPFSFPLHPSLLHLLYKAECIHVQWTTRIPRDLDGGTPSYRVRGVCHLSWGGSYSLGDTNACFLRFIFTTRIFFFLLLLLLLFFFFLLPPLLFSFSRCFALDDRQMIFGCKRVWRVPFFPRRCLLDDWVYLDDREISLEIVRVFFYFFSLSRW